MQPYLFPYLGYYQLLIAADKFVFFDDVNYINKGWINRNNLLQIDKPLLFTVPLLKASQNKLINEIELVEFEKWKIGFLKQLKLIYGKAPYFEEINSWLIDFFSSQKFTHISQLAIASIKAIATFLSIDIDFLHSSQINYSRDFNNKGQDKILDICSILHTTHYINAINGKELYNNKIFEKHNIYLNFIQMEEIAYPQWKNISFVPHLSIIDVLMFNSKANTINLLNKFKLV